MLRLFKKYPFAASAALGFVFLIPLIILEIINRWEFKENFPYSVFIFTWGLQSAFIFFLLQTIQMIRHDNSSKKDPFGIFLRVVGLGIIVYIWGGWIMDQWPCLMGVPNCD